MTLVESPIYISRYQLKARKSLNAVSSRRSFDGVLIRIGEGYGCIHPWTELGDPPLEKCLADLADARRWSIVRRAIRCAEYDCAARQFEHSLFEDMEVPQSHATLAFMNAAELETAIEAGFSTIKLKCGRDPQSEMKFLDEMTTAFSSLRWRLDFNESLTPDEAADFITGLGDKTRATIDFIEDPCPYSDSSWRALHQKTRVPLAVDREASTQSSAAQVMVIKPAIDEPFLLAEAAIAHRQKVVLTSYMDHPVGQTFAAWEAARLGLQFPGLPGLCGLQTHHLFEPNEFTEYLGPWSPDFTVPAGNGLGFDDLLDALPWTRLH